MFAVATTEPAPMMEINITPLVDVMLVLLVMMIITIPPQTHAVKLDLPTPSEIPWFDPVKNVLVVTAAGETMWNGAVVSDAQLRAVLSATAATDPAPEVHFRPEAKARYARVDEVLAISKQAGVTSMGFVGNEAFMDAF